MAQTYSVVTLVGECVIKAEFQPVPTANKHGALMWNAALMKAIGIIEEAK